MNKFHSAILTLSFVMTGLFSARSYAVDLDPQLIDVNFGGGTYATPGSTDQTLLPYVGSAVIGSSTDVFNNFEATADNTSLPLVDAAGVATDVTLNFQADYGYITSSSDDGFLGTTYNNLMTSYLATYGEPTARTVSISGLNPGDYNLYVLSQNNQPSSTAFTVGSTTLTTVNADPSLVSTFIADENYVEFSNVVVDSTGDLSFSYVINSTTGDSGILNGFQLEAAPEPSAWAMMLAGSVGVLVWQFRRRRA